MKRDRKLAVLTAVFLAQRVVEVSSIYPTVSRKAFFPSLGILDPIPRNQPYRMAGLGTSFIPNVSTMYEVEDVRGYTAMTFLPLYETYPLWCVHQPVWFNRIDDPQKPFLSFLNVRYILAAPGVPTPSGWPTLSEAPGGRVIENPAVLPRAFIPFEVFLEPDRSKQVEVMTAVFDFGRRGVATRWQGRTPGTWSANGSGRVSIASYRPQSLSLDVEAQEETLVATSLTGWKGWNLEIDGITSDLVEYNHAFLAFVVPAGHHRATLTYFPRSFAIGGAISLVTLAGVIATLRRRARARHTRRLARLASPP
jgi:hypothetical protein